MYFSTQFKSDSNVSKDIITTSITLCADRDRGGGLTHTPLPLRNIDTLCWVHLSFFQVVKFLFRDIYTFILSLRLR